MNLHIVIDDFLLESSPEHQKSTARLGDDEYVVGNQPQRTGKHQGGNENWLQAASENWQTLAKMNVQYSVVKEIQIILLIQYIDRK